MSYWIMQLHPVESQGAVKHTRENLSANCIGVAFAADAPDLMTAAKSKLPKSHRNYWAFARELKLGDCVLLFAHHFPSNRPTGHHA